RPADRRRQERRARRTPRQRRRAGDRPRAAQTGCEADAMTAQEAFTMMVKDEIAPALRELGFKGSGQRFTLPSETHWALLGLQKFTWSDRDRVDFYRGDELVGSGETDGDGRIRELADGAPGTYRIVFHPPSPFFRRVELEVELGDGHYHVPLLVSSYACATYRGS